MWSARRFSNSRCRVRVEMTESTMVLIVFGALTYAQIQRSHIRVELLYTRMGPRVQAAMDVATDLAALSFSGCCSGRP